MEVTMGNIGRISLIGLFFDPTNAIYFSIPLVLYLWFTPDKVFNRPWHKYLCKEDMRHFGYEFNYTYSNNTHTFSY